MTVSNKDMEQCLFWLGYTSRRLVEQVHISWFKGRAKDDSRGIPKKLPRLVEEVTGILHDFVTLDLDENVQALAMNIIYPLVMAWGTYQRQWMGPKHRQLLQTIEDAEWYVLPEVEETQSPLVAPEWFQYQTSFNEMLDAIPDNLSVWADFGSLKAKSLVLNELQHAHLSGAGHVSPVLSLKRLSKVDPAIQRLVKPTGTIRITPSASFPLDRYRTPACCTARQARRQIEAWLREVEQGRRELPATVVEKFKELIVSGEEKTEVDVLAELLDSHESCVCVDATRSLAALIDPQLSSRFGSPSLWLVSATRERLLRAITDPEPEVRRRMLSMLILLREHFSEELFSVISNGLEDTDAGVLEIAVNAIQLLGVDQASAKVPRLKALLEHPSQEVRRRICKTLEWIGFPDAASAIPALVDRVRADEDPDVRHAAVDALITLDAGGKELSEIQDQDTREALISVSREIGEAGRPLRQILMQAPQSGAVPTNPNGPFPESGDVPAAQPPNTPDWLENIFMRDGKYWKIQFQGKEPIRLKNLEGLFYIHTIIQKPWHPWTPSELRGARQKWKAENATRISVGAQQAGQGGSTGSNNSPPPSKKPYRDDSNKVFDREALRDYRDRLQEINDEIEKFQHSYDKPYESCQKHLYDESNESWQERLVLQR